MVEFANGLVLEITDRDRFEKFIQENAVDPGLHYDVWGSNSIPEQIYIVEYRPDETDPYYHCLDKHVNGIVSTHYYDETLLEQLLDENILEKNGYDTEFVTSNR